MTDFFDSYKPFRNFLRQFDLVDSLVALSGLSLNIVDGNAVPDGLLSGVPWQWRDLRKHIYPWDLDLLSRELILNAGRGGRHSLRNWNDLARCINFIRDLDGLAFILGNGGKPDVMFELHRIAHKQFPWQADGGVNPFMRVVKIFGSAAVDEIVKRELNMTSHDLAMLAMALGGNFQRRSDFSLSQDYRSLGVDLAASRAFFQRITSSLPELRRNIQARQRYDHDWLYIWNPLEATPLVRVTHDNPDHVICPIPRYAVRRGSAGIFYDLVNRKGFQNPFGSAFQDYVGEVLHKSCLPPRFKIERAKSYYVHGSVRHGVDWILSDEGAHLIIEAKTKRLTVDARTLADPAALNKDLEVLADAVVQNYANIRDAQRGLTDWKPDARPIWPLILTLEDWFLLSPRVRERLDECIARKLHEEGIDSIVREQMPFAIASSQEIEIAGQVIAQVGIQRVMSHKFGGGRNMWTLMGAIHDGFSNELRRVNPRLFDTELSNMLPKHRGQGR